MSVKNPRFPHRCVIYREEADSFSDDIVREYLYGDGCLESCEGCVCMGTDECKCRCRKESSTSKRTFKTEGVIRSDYRVALPGQVKGIHGGDLMDIVDLQGFYERCEVTDVFATNLGTSIFFQYPKT
jgi:hypothetical protein